MNLDNVKARLIRFEGRIPHMYQCTGGEVTIGVGHAIPTTQEAEKLNLVYEAKKAAVVTSVSAIVTTMLKRTDWTSVKRALPNKPAEFYALYTRLQLPEPEIDALLEQDIAFFTKALHESFRLFDSYPEPAQEAVFDMAFNLGIVGLFQKFPKCVKAIVMKDWNRASSECRRRGISEERNRETAELFNQASVESRAAVWQPSAIDEALARHDRFHAALLSIADLPTRHGYFNGPDAATEAVRIAKEALVPTAFCSVSSLRWHKWLWYRFSLWRFQAWMSRQDFRFRMRYRDRWLRCKHGILEAHCSICPEQEERIQ